MALQPYDLQNERPSDRRPEGSTLSTCHSGTDSDRHRLALRAVALQPSDSAMQLLHEAMQPNSNADTVVAKPPPMGQSLNLVLDTGDEVVDLEVVQREFPDGQGNFEVLHNRELSKSLMSGKFQNCSSTGGVTRYEGTFLNDPHQERPLPHGQGLRENPDGSTYAGQWKDGFPDGRGEWKAPAPSCESYIGEWKKGKKHGFGRHNFANGDSYEGDWEAGKFQDRGKYVYANGDVFMGMYQNGVKVSGTFYFKDGRVSTRKWENGKLISCQDFDQRRRIYHPTISHTQAHAPERNTYGAKIFTGMASPRGVKTFG